jgi:ATP/maltotriose-dependent transcriptional regulator MalT
VTVGREAELAQIDSLLARLEEGAPACVAIDGEPGIGKTRVLRELRQRAEERKYLVLSGSAAEFEQDLPFGAWVDALDAYVAARELELDGPEFAGLEAVLPSRREGPAGGGELVAEERYRAHRAVRSLLELLAADAPLVVILDDLHWADPASVELISGLLRREPEAPLLLALAHRRGKAPAPLRTSLIAAEATPISLGPLSREASVALIGDAAAGTALDAIVDAGAGNPFYSLQLARAATLPAGGATTGSIGVEGVPAAVTDALLVEVGALGDGARALLEAGAVAGDPFELDLAQAVAGLSGTDAGAALDDLLDAGLIHTTEVPRRFSFRHPLVRRAVYEATRTGRRLDAHGRAAAVLAEQGASAAARAHHVEQSAGIGDRDAIAVLLEAAAAARARSPETAVRWYAAALRLLPADEAAERLEVLFSLADAQRLVGRYEDALVTLDDAIGLVPPGDASRRVDLTARCASAEIRLGRHADAKRRLAAVADTLPDPGSAPAIEVALAQSTLTLFTNEHDQSLEHARRALDAARALGDRGLASEAAAALAHVAAVRSEVAFAAELQAEAMRLHEELPDEELVDHLEGVHRLCRASLHLELYEDVVRVAERGLALAGAMGRGELMPLIRSTLAQSTLLLGRLAQAEEAQDAAVEAARLAGHNYYASGILSTTASIALLTGDLESALRAGEESVQIVGPAQEGHVLNVARASLAVTMREAGVPAEEAGPLVEGVGGWSLRGIPAVWRVRHLEALTRVAVEAGDAEGAAECARLASEGAEELALPVARAVAQRAGAAALLAAGDAAGAVEPALASAEAAAAGGARVDAARSRALAGQACAGAGDRDRAVELLRRAEAELDECGATHPRNEARRELRRLGARAEPRGPGSSEETGLGALSKREREVAELVHERKTNREIAEELYLSEKTIESHLRNVFFKLGVSSRREVALAVARASTPAP